MIDTLSIVSNGGIVLWERSSDVSRKCSIINQVVQEFLLEDRAGMHETVIGDYKVHWMLENDAHFFVVAIHPKFVSYPQMCAFLRTIARCFVKKYGRVRDNVLVEYDFSAEYAETLSMLDAGVPGVDALGGGDQISNGDTEGEEEDEDLLEDAADGEPQGEGECSAAGAASGAYQGPDTFVTKTGHVIGRKGKKLAGSKSTTATSQKRSKQVKRATRWDEPSADSAVEEQRGQGTRPTEEELEVQTALQRAAFIKRLPNGSVAPVREKEWEGQQRGLLANWLRSYVGRRELDSQDFNNVIPGLREKLITKNVAVEVAEHVCKSVEASLTGKVLGTFESLHQCIEAAMISALRRILQPKHEINILRAVASSRGRNKPYSIVLCGVNGVGKSTTLAKITYWLQQNGHTVMIAAGDTFRHGAVEQLEVHGRCLGVDVFQMGYGTDPSAVAAAAISRATRDGCDVVMIDTAGRMQDHESRMRALAKLIHDNQPDLVLFVGEALVGNTGVDQLRRFNQCLVDFVPVGSVPRGIDGIVLTKFDTIDDKVGAAVSMVYELGQPIVFVGAGQTYQDLKVMEPDVVVSALMA
ncbi:signal recognition particle receptor alpha subunit, putative [Trypanosoma brucei gambiense DAL972]|uniref:Signal recognition particle receptor alpha subunit, putative n=2 Tax=Trypanosoma brucei TaxID=5691 RepID=D0A8J2_TRYB9|nr:signal recognition particle receptor alpha subunit, putative [Trypanosoma brucei gambiense DAL972]RHW67880.1 signal recognition particle receptor alpha subunit [Trypanosoma brucei equiperdum]CBH17993.1 signal recognition particle receptor alpha subunit, putative [Trypanosoma brucei gambiense DAL972]|eukprot:XP_011780257.1 signal recognition particle receptor alpha subunit, putative [Trypanosoma brucei gambiense DAL972]